MRAAGKEVAPCEQERQGHLFLEELFDMLSVVKGCIEIEYEVGDDS